MKILDSHLCMIAEVAYTSSSELSMIATVKPSESAEQLPDYTLAWVRKWKNLDEIDLPGLN
jgi:hypothetical protein